MPAVSEAQRRKMALLKRQGKIAASVADEYIHTKGKLPERVGRKAKPAPRKGRKRAKS